MECQCVRRVVCTRVLEDIFCRDVARRSASHQSAMSGVIGSSLLRETAFLSAAERISTAGAFVCGVPTCLCRAASLVMGRASETEDSTRWSLGTLIGRIPVALSLGRVCGDSNAFLWTGVAT